MYNSLLISALWVLLIAALIACRKDSKDGDNRIYEIRIMVDYAALEVGERLPIQAVALNRSGNVIEDRHFDWTVSEPSVLQLEAGVLVALSSGHTTLVAQSDGVLAEIGIHVASAEEVVFPVELSGDLPADLKGKVTNLYTESGVFPLTENSRVIIGRNRSDQLIFAADTDGNPTLMGYLGPENNVLGVEEIGVALVRFLLSASASDAATLDLRAIISEAPSYSALVKAVNSAVEEGVPPLDSEDVLSLVSSVAYHVERSFAQAADRKASKVAAADTKGIKPEELPFYFSKGLLEESNIWLEDAAEGRVKVFNASRLAWKIRHVDNDLGLVNGAIALPWVSFPGALYAYPEPVAVQIPMMDGRMSLELYQDEETKANHIVNLINMAVNVVAASVGGHLDRQSECALSISQRIRNERMGELLTKADGAAARAYVLETLNQFFNDGFFSLAKDCFILSGRASDYLSGGNRNPQLKAALKVFLKLTTMIEVADQMASFTVFSYQLFHFWDFTGSVTFCKNQGRLVECVKSLDVEGPADSVAVGYTIPLRAMLFGEHGSDLTDKQLVVWSSSDQGIAVVDRQGVVRGLAEGNVEIKAAIGAVQSSYSLRVIPGDDDRNWCIIDVFYKQPRTGWVTFRSSSKNAVQGDIELIDQLWGTSMTCSGQMGGEGTIGVRYKVRRGKNIEFTIYQDDSWHGAGGCGDATLGPFHCQ